MVRIGLVKFGNREHERSSSDVSEAILASGLKLLDRFVRNCRVQDCGEVVSLSVIFGFVILVGVIDHELACC